MQKTMDTRQQQPPPIAWLLACDEPWTRYRTLLDLLDTPADDPQVQQARAGMLAHPAVSSLINAAATWPGYPLQRHNDSRHPLHALGVLADFGLVASDPGMQNVIAQILAHQSPEGPFQTLANVPVAFGGTGEDLCTWMACDAPLLLSALIAFGLRQDERLPRAADHLLSLAQDGGWRCAVAPELGKFRGPGRKADPCPIANLLALRALAGLPEHHGSPAVQAGSEMLLSHWAQRNGQKYYLFGAGTDYRKFKYPLIWYDVLHVADVLTRFPALHGDPRLASMLAHLAAQADLQGRYTAASMYQPWKGWSFADKKHPSPWLTFLVLRIQRRLNCFLS